MSKNSAPGPIAIVAAAAPVRTKSSNYPEPFFSHMNNRQKRPLGELFGIKNFGVNLTRLVPGGNRPCYIATACRMNLFMSLKGSRLWLPTSKR